MLATPGKDAAWLELLRAAATPYIGTAVGQVPERLSVAGLPAPDVDDPIGDALAAVPGILGRGTLLMGIVGLLLMGVYLTIREPLAVVPTPLRSIARA